ncbi:phosphatidylglycerophosphatase A [Andreprevotia lacus DSM 23236]|jgi:phosphatidylglycerophosphatase A|uniref:Phosphatidylglycerophosphatase A n=1 Tax=Andreprevotia lacus DSM 23236 TaxID=1121001 RepID=A0A1W1XNF1_9NEIS|nr:phosphatidylglycerophosphatase A [Andreprevotia lacus]SMC25493.1 phosphatidylglycerophosphatase A [Andreprevotia lacus DSM 23236]
MPAILHPDRRFLFAHPAHFIALGFGSGLPRKAPGTWGTLAALPLYALLMLALTPLQIVLLCIPVFLLGWWAADKTGKALGVHDHGSIVIDEIVAMWLVLAYVPVTWLGWLLAFGLFRLFDIVKPWPIRWFDERVPGGFGVMLDDLLAAGFAVAVLWGLLHWHVI